ncbi:MAG: hypothetical protein ABII00_05915 [Elusimicrobiota bacterium]
MTSGALAALLMAGGARAAFAVRPEPHHRDDAGRFGLDRPEPPRTRAVGRSRRARAAVRRFNGARRGRHSLRFGPKGVGPGGTPRARVEAREVAVAFLREYGPELGLRADELRLELGRTAGGIHHLLFEQVVEGVPVEFSRVKVHLDEAGAILSLQSSYRPGVRESPVPRLDEAAAALRAAADLGGAAPRPRGGRLVFFPLRGSDAVRLAWRFRVSGRGGGWIYYVDAGSGEILLRYNDLRFQAACASSGTVTGNVYDIDAGTSPLSVRPFKNQRVYVVDSSTFALTDANGFFCSQTAGKIFTSLQGPYVHVANFNVPNAHYDNGGGKWKTFSTPLSSPHPYSNDAVLISTINATPQDAPGAVKLLPVFSSFDVGGIEFFAGDLEITDDDQVAILDADGYPVAGYLGNRGPFNGAAVAGTQLRLRLKSNESGTRNGFDISHSSYLYLTNSPGSSDNATATFTWTTARTFDGTEDEINLFYHINRMHDYFADGPNSADGADIDKPVPVMARAGPGLSNAFYDPLHENLMFGDVGNSLALDASVVRHEYVHFVVDQIYPIINFGQFGAISEALADYFAASSLGNSAIGTYANVGFQSEGALRELDCPSETACVIFPAHWTGAIHDDSRMISQAVWGLRGQLMTQLGAANGQACADGLVFQALFFFPDSFEDFLEAMLEVDKRAAALVAACGGDNLRGGDIVNAFALHNIVLNPPDEDVYEPNNGIQSATDITTAPVISARIYPAADLDYYAFGAAEGLIRLTLTLPQDPGFPGTYRAYSMSLIDSRYEIVRKAGPVIDINPTLGGYCPDTGCRTSSRKVVLEYVSPRSDQYFLVVSAPEGDEYALVTNNNSTEFYGLEAEYSRAGPVASSIVAASFDNDVISFEVRVATFVTSQNYMFHHARLRDHALRVLPGTATDGASPFLTFVSSSNGLGRVSGTLALASGFNERFRAVGTVHLEVFGGNPLGHVQSLGFSPAINLTADRTALTPFNNVFNPSRGEFTTIRYEIQSAGHVRLRLFTRTGRHVLTLIDEFKPAGKGSVDWSGANRLGSRVASGIYLLNLEAPGIRETKKVIVVK